MKGGERSEWDDGTAVTGGVKPGGLEDDGEVDRQCDQHNLTCFDHGHLQRGRGQGPR